MKANNNETSNNDKKNDKEVELKQEIFTNLFSTSMFKLEPESISDRNYKVYEFVSDEKGKRIQEQGTQNNDKEKAEGKKRCATKYPVFAKDKNGNLKFVDGKNQNQYHAEDEFSFAEALGFLKHLCGEKIGQIEETYIEINNMLDKAKKFLGIKKEKENEDLKLKDIFMKLKKKDNRDKYNEVITAIYTLPKYAGKLDNLLNKKIKSIDHTSLMTISTEIREAYFNFQDKIKSILNSMDEIIDSLYEKPFSKIIEGWKDFGESLPATEQYDCELFVAAQYIWDYIICEMKADAIFLNKNKELIDIYDSSTSYVSDCLMLQEYGKINKDIIKRLSVISQFCISYLRHKPFVEA